MSLISQCPKCREPVTVPDGLAPEAEVRCPLCEVIYPLAEALADLPPELIPVAVGSTEHAEAESEGGPPGGETVGPAESGIESTEDEEEGGVELVEDAVAGIETARPSGETYALAGLAIETGDEAQAADATRRTVRPRRKNEKGPFRFLAEVFIGGLLGLTVAYYAICWTLGSRSGLPELPLPLLPHTMHWFDATATQGEPADAAREP